MWRCPVAACLTLLCACTDSDPCERGVAGTLCPVAGTGDAAFNGDGHTADSTSFYLPSSARRGPDGLLYVMDYNNHRLRRIDWSGTVQTLAGDGFHAGATAGAIATESSLENPIEFDFLPDGRVIFVSYHDPRVMTLEPDGTLGVIAGDVFQAERPHEGDGLPTQYARFFELTGITIAPDNAIYLADATGNVVRVIRNGVIYPFAGTGGQGYSGDGGPAVDAVLSGPSAVAADASGNVYIADSLNSVVRRVAADGTISTFAGTGVRGFSGDGGAATEADLSQPYGVEVSPEGSVYIADRYNGSVRVVPPDGIISTLAGDGTLGHDGDFGPASDARLGGLNRIHLDRDGGLLVADQTNNCIRKILPPVAGSPLR